MVVKLITSASIIRRIWFTESFAAVFITNVSIELDLDGTHIQRIPVE